MFIAGVMIAFDFVASPISRLVAVEVVVGLMSARRHRSFVTAKEEAEDNEFYEEMKPFYAERLAGEIPRAKAELAKHCTEITRTPEGDNYKLSGEWDLLGDVRSDGAGGPDCYSCVGVFSIPLAA